MVRRLAPAAAIAVLSCAAAGLAQTPSAPIPLYPGAAAPPSIAPEPLPPVAPARPKAPPAMPAPGPAAGPGPAIAMTPPIERVFCGQSVTVSFADPAAVPERYRRFIGMWSDAAWTPQLCAALLVENVTADGAATILYAFGPMGSNTRGPGGVLHGTGVVRDGELRFQNSDGSQFAFRPAYADLDGRLTTPQGQSYASVFKKTP